LSKEGKLGAIAQGEARSHWLDSRRRLERRMAETGLRQTQAGPRALPPGRLVNLSATLACRATLMYERGRRNALDFRIHTLDMAFAGLPQAFDGYTILFLSDLHAAALPQIMPLAGERVAGLACDVAVLGGDYQCLGAPAAAEVTRVMAPLLRHLTPPEGVVADGVLAVLGNHDGHDMAEALERQGVRLLINQSWVIERGGQRLVFTGTDDVNTFYTEAAAEALRQAPEGFRIAVIHSPEFATVAAEAGCSLYLAGHTHGGQICLPGGRPLLTGLDSHRQLAVGPWHWRGMQGYTSTGLGAGAPSLRFNCPGEVAVIRLRRSNGSG
jgi:predicted MPP superfamily phosphohydrolase